MRIYHPCIYLNPCWTHLYPQPLQLLGVMSSRCGEGAFPKPLPPAQRVLGLGERGERLRACSPTPASPSHGPKTQLRAGTGPLGVPGHSKTLILGLSTPHVRASLGSSGGTPQILDLLWLLQERDRSPRKRFQPTKIAGIPPNQTRMLGLEGAQKPFVLWFPVVSLNFYRLEPRSRCCS